MISIWYEYEFVFLYFEFHCYFLSFIIYLTKGKSKKDGKYADFLLVSFTSDKYRAGF